MTLEVFVSNNLFDTFINKHIREISIIFRRGKIELEAIKFDAKNNPKLCQSTVIDRKKQYSPDFINVGK